MAVTPTAEKANGGFGCGCGGDGGGGKIKIGVCVMEKKVKCDSEVVRFCFLVSF